MSRSYKATGINLKAMPMGETDRLLTILTIEHGLIRVMVPGARKHKSRLGGRSSQFVVNDVFIIQGKSLDKLVQAETVRSFPALSADLARLTASQYLAELVLCLALSEQPQGELFALLVEQLQQLEHVAGDAVLACLNQSIFQLLTFAGVAPELGRCGHSQTAIAPDFQHPDWRVGFSTAAGGVVSSEHLTQATLAPKVRTSEGRYAVDGSWRAQGRRRSPKEPPTTLLTAQELVLLQQLSETDWVMAKPRSSVTNADETRLMWIRIERLLRQYAEYHFDRTIRSATLIDACFTAAVPSE